MNDEENIALIKQALKDYEDGALIEARVALATVVNRIDAFEIVEGSYDIDEPEFETNWGEGIMAGYPYTSAFFPS